MIVNTKKYFYNYNVHGDGYDKFNFGVVTVENESCFDPLEYIKKKAKHEYPDHTFLNITALNLI
jgi:hypothetical protein